MPIPSLEEALDGVSKLQEQLLVRQRLLKSKSENAAVTPLAVSESVSQLLNALESIHEAELDSLQRLEKQTQVLTSLALLFGLVRLEESASVPVEEAQRSIEVAWTLWPPVNTGLGTLRCRETICNLLNCHSAAPSVVDRLVSLCSQSPLGTKRTLACLQELLNAGHDKAVEAAIPHLDQRCLDLLRQSDVSTQAGRLYNQLVCIHVAPEADDFGRVLLQLREALIGDTQAGGRQIAPHLLPTLVKTRPKLFRALYSEMVADGRAHLASFLAVAHAGFASSLVKRSELPDELLLASIEHRDTSIRSGVLDLLSDAPSTALRLTTVEFDILSAFFEYDMGPTDGDFRQATGAAWAQLLGRIRTSVYAADRNAKGAKKHGAQDVDAGAYVRSVELFLQGVLAKIGRALLPCSPYRVQRGALASLSTLLASGIDPTYRGELDKAAQKIVLQSKTQPTAGPLWPLELKICNIGSVHALLRCLLSTYDDVRNHAFAILLDFSRPLPGLEDPVAVERKLVQPAIQFMRNRRESETSSASLILQLAWRLMGTDDVQILLRTIAAAEEDVTVAEQDLVTAAQHHPMHGSLLCICQLLTAVYKTSPQLLTPALFARLLQLIERVWAVVEPVLCHASPEGIEINGKAVNGHTIIDDEDARAFNMLRNEDAEDADEADYDEAAGPRHKVLLSAVWRAAKEAAALLEACVVLPAASGRVQEIWSVSQVEQIGHLFALWLLRIRHRGAFSAIYPGYSRICRALIEYGIWAAVQNVPERLLDMHLRDLRHRQVSITRRSAGLPFCVLGVLTGVRQAAPALVSKTVSALLDTAEDSDNADDVRVHTFNTLMILHRDAELAGVLNFSIERSFALSIRCFDSASWNIRNVSTLLFASLVHRVLGHRANSMSIQMQQGARRTFSHEFFKRFPALQPLLLAELATAVQHGLHDVPSIDMHSSLHSILLLLSLLSTPLRTAGAQEMCAAYVQLIERCASSRVWRIREAAAEALAALLCPEDVLDRLEGTSLRALERSRNNNELHGLLLQFLRPLQRIDLSYTDVEPWARAFDASLATLLSNRPLPCQEAAFAIACTIGRAKGADKPSCTFPQLFDRALHIVTSTDLVDEIGYASCHTSAAELLRLDSPAKALLGTTGNMRRLLQRDTNHEPRAVLQEAVASNGVTSATVVNFEGPQRISAEDFDSLFGQAQVTKSVPHRHHSISLLGSAVKIAEQTAQQAEQMLDLLLVKTREDGTEEARKAAVSALADVPVAFHTIPSYQAILMRVLQDDDAVVRRLAEETSRGQSAQHGLRQVQEAAKQLVSLQGGDAAISEYLLADIDDLIARLKHDDESLFARERANLFKDDVFEAEALCSAVEASLPAPMPRTRKRLEVLSPQLQAFLDAEDSDDGLPFGVRSKAAFGLLTFKVAQAVNCLEPSTADQDASLTKRLTVLVGIR